MRDPINKRIFRDLRKDWKRYVVLFLLMTFMIAAASGIFVANSSMMQAIDESEVRYNMEDGRFELKEEATAGLLDSLPDDITVYELFAKELSENEDAVVRVYKIRREVNLACVIEGRLPEGAGEIAIDRMHADNRSISIGDTVRVGNKDLTVVGLIALPDYSCLFKKNSDVMFNAIDFDVALVTDEAWEELDANIIYTYSYQFRDRSGSEAEIKDRSDDLVEQLAVLAATGGYTDDAGEAEELAEDIDQWKAFLEDIGNQGAALEQRGEELAQRQAELEAQSDLIVQGDPEILARMAELSSDAEALQADIDALSGRQDEIDGVVRQLEALEEYEDDINELMDFIPGYSNQAMNFAPEDLGSDNAMMGVLVYVFIAVLAFVFAITTNNTITNEAAVIGTLRATGYTRGELVRYYMLTPIVITLISAVAGNILGYTVFKDAVVAMYYNSYSLVTYETVWNAKAFVITTLIPLILMCIINLIIIVRLMKLPPLKFLRRDLSTSKRKKAIRLPRMSFLGRFRLRVFLQNIGGYIILLFGISFVMLLLAFSVGLPETLTHYRDELTDNLIAENQYILKDCKDEDGNILHTDNPLAEPFSTETLLTTDGVRTGEEITVYGVTGGSRYIVYDTELTGDEVLVSSAYAQKFLLREGDTLVLKKKYSDDSYTFTVKGIYDSGSMAVFIPNDRFNEVFDRDPGSFNGFFCDSSITDIERDMIYTVITREDVMALSIQIEHSMGNYMDYVSVACLIIGVMVIYLLTKIIIEKNAASISMIKVLGYENSEINSIYIRLTTVMVIIFSAGSALLGVAGLSVMFRFVMYTMSGWFATYISPVGILKMVLIMLASYAIVAFFDVHRIKKVPLTDALKNVE